MDCIDFAQRLLRIPSLPGQEGELAALVQAEMTRLGFDEVGRDEAGNVIGRVKGEGTAPSIMFNTHLDHVDPGDARRWPSPPYGGELREGRLVGRGAVDIKGPLASQLYGVAQLTRAGRRPPGDVYVTAVVQEEVGGLGAWWLCRRRCFDCVVVGEPSSCRLRRGHRGRAEFQVLARGRSCHASVPDQGLNPLEMVARFILALPQLTRVAHAELGAGSAAATLIATDQTSPNVIPGEVRLTIDWRTVPGEDPGEALASLRRIAAAATPPGGSIRVEPVVQTLRTYTGLVVSLPVAHPAFLLGADHPAVLAAEQVLGEVMEEPGPAGLWRFATDGGHFAQAGMLVLGFGPGDPDAAHTVGESIAVEELRLAEAAVAALAAGLPLRLAPVLAKR